MPFSFLSKLSGNAKYSTISAAEAKIMMEQNPSAIILDVREPDEYRAAHIPHAKSLPLGQIQAKAAAELPDKDAPLLVYCLSGGRSASAAGKLAALGYTKVFNFGGISAWPYETVH